LTSGRVSASHFVDHCIGPGLRPFWFPLDPAGDDDFHMVLNTFALAIVVPPLFFFFNPFPSGGSLGYPFIILSPRLPLTYYGAGLHYFLSFLSDFTVHQLGLLDRYGAYFLMAFVGGQGLPFFSEAPMNFFNLLIRNVDSLSPIPPSYFPVGCGDSIFLLSQVCARNPSFFFLRVSFSP